VVQPKQTGKFASVKCIGWFHSAVSWTFIKYGSKRRYYLVLLLRP
jgi:hypothetical protein